MNKREKLLIIFSDIDRTYEPIKNDTECEFIGLVKEIREKEGINVKLSFITGRQALMAKADMNRLKGTFAQEGIKDFTDWGAGEQGALLVGEASPEVLKFAGNVSEKVARKRKRQVRQLLKQSPLWGYLAESMQNIYMNAFFFKEDEKTVLSETEKKSVYQNVVQLLKSDEKLWDKIKVVCVGNCIEVTAKGCGKDIAVKSIVEEYSKKYDVVGITYSGDSDNDLSAVKYVSNLSEFKGMKSNVLLPSNAKYSIEADSVEKWKEKFADAGFKKRISKANEEYFKGVITLLRDKLEKGELIEKDRPIKNHKDDFFVSNYDNNPASDRMNKLKKWEKKNLEYKLIKKIKKIL